MSLIRWLRVILASVWVLLIAAIVSPSEGVMHELALMLFMALLIAHVAECVVFAKRLRATGGSLPWHLGMTLVFGVLYAGPRLHGFERD